MEYEQTVWQVHFVLAVALDKCQQEITGQISKMVKMLDISAFPGELVTAAEIKKKCPSVEI